MIGKKLGGRYKIINQLGQGGFGTTYLALDTQRPSNPECVVKQFKPLTSDPQTIREARRLFNKEAEILEKLGKYDQIPQLLAHFEENQEFYLIQEYVLGHDLSEELPPVGNPLNETEVVKLLIEILEVLQFVHQHKVIHRDIKPSNIRRRQLDRKIVLIDFGAVKEVKTLQVNHQGQTNFTVAIGTPGYMPSEQANCNPQFSSDVYAVGIIGIQAYTGIYPDSQLSSKLPTDPYTGEIAWHKEVKVKPQLAEILDKMIRYDFRQRYPTAESALQALQQLSSFGMVTLANQTVKVSFLKLYKQKSITTILPKFVIGLVTLGVSAAIILLVFKVIPRSNKFLTYKNLTYGIQIKYPDTWQRQDIENPVTKELVTFLSPQQSNTDIFQEKLTISVENFSGTLKESTNLFINDINNYLPEAKIVKKIPTTLANKPAQQLIFTGKSAGKSIKILQTWTLKGDRAYIITYTAITDDYENFINIVETIMKSLKIDDKNFNS